MQKRSIKVTDSRGEVDT